MAAIEGPKHAECVHQKLHFWKFLWTVCSTTQSTVELMMTWMMSTAFRCSRNRLSNRSPLCWFNEYVHVHMVVLQRRAYRIFKSASFSERVLLVSGFLSLPFLTRFPHMRCHIQGQGFGTECIFQNYSQLLDICTQLVLKTAEELIVPSVFKCNEIKNQQPYATLY